MTDPALPSGDPAAASDQEAAIDRMVRRFYALALASPELGPMFREAIPDLESHLGIIVDFWATSLLGVARYKGNPFMAHAKLPIEASHFDVWLALFEQAVGEHLPPELAAPALGKARQMSKSIKVGLLTVPAVRFSGT